MSNAELYHVQNSAYCQVLLRVQRLKWNVGGSSTRKPGNTGIRGVLRDHKGVQYMFFMPLGIKDSNEAQLIAVIKALELSSIREECIRNFLQNDKV